jgi:phosphatidate cytidylyltransferase
MLLQRVITALVLLAVLLPAMLVAPAWPFAVLTLVAIGAAGWEWGRLNGASASGSVVMGVLVALACGIALMVGAVRVPGTNPLWWLAVLLWVLGGAWAIKVGPTGWPRLSRALRWGIGMVALFTAWLALATAKAVGLNFLLSVFCLVWVADIAAYFGGRTFGRRKLAPAISPGKSWEGVWSGMAGVVALAFAWMAAERHFVIAEPSVYSLLNQRLGTVGLVLALIFLAAMSVVGDLTESLVKRAAGAKDSSRLLPGHGGVLDRIDALLPVFPIAMALSFF